MLTDTIDCTGVNYTPIGDSGSPFTGNFKGNGFSINNVTINSASSGTGIFGHIAGATLSNVAIWRANITGGANYTGALVGIADTSSTITAIHVSSSTIIGQNDIGGIVGHLDTSTLSRGSLGSNTIEGSVADPSASSDVGGAIGSATNSTISTSFVDGGSVIGNNNGSSSNNTGGFIGTDSFATYITDSYSTATVTGDTSVGGMVGYSASSGIIHSYASGSVTGNTNVGGITGFEGASGNDNDFATGNVTGTTNVGGFIGRVVAVGGDATNSFFDETTTGQTDCVGLDNGISLPTTCSGVDVGSSQPTYFDNNTTNQPLANWDFTNVWRVNATGLPTLVTAPARPNTVRVIRTPTSMQVIWAYPADDGGSAVTSYDLGYKLSGSATGFTIIPGLSASTLTDTITGLSPNTQYDFAVRANNALGNGTWLEFVTSTTASGTIATNIKAPDTGFGLPASDELTIFLIGSSLTLAGGLWMSFGRQAKY